MRSDIARAAVAIVALSLLAVHEREAHVAAWTREIARSARRAVVWREALAAPEPVRVLLTLVDSADQPIPGIAVTIDEQTEATNEQGDVWFHVSRGRHDVKLPPTWMVAWSQPVGFVFDEDTEQVVRVQRLCAGPTFLREADGTPLERATIRWTSDEDRIIHQAKTDTDGLVVGLPYRACGGSRVGIDDTGNMATFVIDAAGPVTVTLPGLGTATVIVAPGFDDPFVECAKAESVDATAGGFEVVAYGDTTRCTVGATDASTQSASIALDGETHAIDLEEARFVDVYTEPNRSGLRVRCGADDCDEQADRYVCPCPSEDAFLHVRGFRTAPVPPDVDSITLDLSDTKGSVVAWWEGALPCTALIEFRTGSIESRCDPDGRVAFGQEVASGPATLTVQALGEQGRRELDVPPGGTAIVGRILPDEGSVSGRIVSDTDLNGVELRATKGRPSLDPATGRFEVTSLPPGAVRVWLRVLGDKSERLDVTAGEHDVEWSID